jgi:hypothetical protein
LLSIKVRQYALLNIKAKIRAKSIYISFNYTLIKEINL